MKKIISFCLYGKAATYITGMKENILLAKKHFSDWIIRIHYNDTVDIKFINEYKSLGAECILCSNVGSNKMNWEGMFWRWFPLDDRDVSYWLSRDADSRLSAREANMVKQWTSSNKTLHSIRDHRCHFNPIMGGMFGINNILFRKRYKFKKVKDIINNLHVFFKEKPYNVDQIFLNESQDGIWERLKNDVMAHISNGGRRIYKEDIDVPPCVEFIGKQYRLNDFPENKMQKLEGKKGCYWKKSGSSDINWSNSNKDIKPDVTFKTEGDYYKHRVSKGYPQNWCDIFILDGIEVNDNTNYANSINKTTIVKENSNGCYWKYNNKSDVYWSNDSKNIIENIKFDNATEFMSHRVNNGYPSNWSQIKVFDEKDIIKNGCYWKTSNNKSIYWSNSDTNIQPDITFKSIPQYYKHREENGYPCNWSKIKVIPNKPSINTQFNTAPPVPVTIPTNTNQNNNNQGPLVSIAISTYEANGKGVQLLSKAMESINNQTYTNIEVVISDHSSNNKIKSFLKKFEKKYSVKYFHNPNMKGNSSHNTNNAINHCSGDYIKILFMDDYLYNNNAILNIVEHFKKYPKKKWLVNSYEHTKNYKDFFNHHTPSISADIIFCNRIGCPSCLTICKSVKERFDEKLKWFMDGEYYYRLNKLYNNPIYLYTIKGRSNIINLIHDNQLTNQCYGNSKVENEEKKYIKNKHLLK
tara:strand:- start:337 stop:2418 length:2082 start_codon:yes stop_codon:yes gene_type:complete